MYGKYFASTFTGSMMASGPEVFAVWGYVIAHSVKSQVELNPRFLAAVIGSSTEKMREAIDKLCATDAESRSKDEDGRRLVREGEYQYRVVNHVKYRNIRDEDGRREYNRDKKREERARKAVSTAVKQPVNDISRLSIESAHTEAEEDTETKSASERSFPARDARIATTVPTEPQLARAPALSEPQVNHRPTTAMPDLETDMAKAYAAVMQIGITGIGPGDPRLRALLVQGATVEEIKGVALQGARSSRGSWAWVSAAVEGKRRDASRISLAPGPLGTTPTGREPVFNGGGPPPEETPERRAARLARAGFVKTPDQLATETLAALQAKRGTNFPTQSDRDDA